ncbi:MULTISPECIES: hypothetical protein [Dysgonomonas]|uniref:hypothetical protein n=1 Tax=Dysgonomonas TaxID=156973 RepID=UPI000A73F1EF|nr:MULTISPECIES: hypothetical protein [Dysgonomonas]MBN9300224.1 hypothetical protein [Dysgonomonas mossii]
MTGKIFPESNNIYQDLAKILFKYYRQAAEKIVQEEERIEKEIAILEEEKSFKDQELSKTIYWLFTIILFFVYFIKKNQITKEIDDLDSRINEFRKQHSEIFRDYKVSKLGVAYVPVADQIKYEDKSFIIDYTGKVNESEITLQLSRQNDLLVETIADLEQLSSEAPIVETSKNTETIDTDDYSTSIQQINQHDYFGKLERSLRTISYCMDDLDTTSVSLPLVADKSDYLQLLNEYATSDIPDNAPIVEVFDKGKYAGSISKFQELNKLKDALSNKTSQFEDVLKGLMMTMANSVQAISSLKIASTDKVVFESNKVLYQILKSPYNHYSPALEFSEIERIRNEKFDYSESVQGYEPFQLKPSSRVKYNLLSDMWTAEDGSTTNFPFGVHQIYEEIVAPVVQNLMQENRIERLKIYNHIKDQKIDYLNKWHQETDNFYLANRAESADIINLMRESLREYVAAYNTLVSYQKTEENMEKSGGSLDSAVIDVIDNSKETLAAFEIQSKQFKTVQDDFEDYMVRLKDDIDIKAKRFGHIEYYDAKLRDGHSSEIAVAANEVRDLDDRRKPLASVNALFAKISELPPVPQVEDIIFEHISLNLPNIAKSALQELGGVPIKEEPQNKENKDHASEDNHYTSEEKSNTACYEEVVTKKLEIEEVIDNQHHMNTEHSVGEKGNSEIELEDRALHIYSEEELTALPDERLKEICKKMGIEYNDTDFDKDYFISEILYVQGNNNE